MGERLFSVVDVETTGLNPQRRDRVTEVAIVTVDRDGTVVDRWETLVNPDRDLGVTRLHGITAAEVMDAPRFEDIAEELAWRLSGTVPVAHNLHFDAKFLRSEFHRAGIEVHPTYFRDGLCTMRLSSRYLRLPNWKLATCCREVGFEIERAHCAGDDAQAAAELLGVFINSEPEEDFYDRPFESVALREWWVPRPSQCVSCCLRGRDAVERPHFLARIVEALPGSSHVGAEGDYLSALDRVLLDRVVSRHEESELIELAAELGIGRSRAVELHREYLGQMVDVALADGMVTREETADLHDVAALLAVPREVLEETLASRMGQREMALPGKGGGGELPAVAGGLRLDEGDLVVLTGDMAMDRKEIEALLRARGLVPHSGVTKKVKLLVAADPDSMSGKAKKARSYGIPVVGEDYLWEFVLGGDQRPGRGGW